MFNIDIQNFLISNIIWEIIFSFILIGFVWRKVIRKQIQKFKLKKQAKEIAWKLLYKNREWQRGAGWHYADRFIDLYQTSFSQKDLRRGEDERTWQSKTLNTWVLDEKLIEEFNLAELYESRGQKCIRLKDSQKQLNSYIYQEIKNTLIKLGDNPNFYPYK